VLSQEDLLWKDYKLKLTAADIIGASRVALQATRLFGLRKEVTQAAVWHREVQFSLYLLNKRVTLSSPVLSRESAESRTHQRLSALLRFAWSQALQLKFNDAFVALGRCEEIAALQSEGCSSFQARIYGLKAFSFARSGEIERAVLNYRLASSLMLEAGERARAAAFFNNLAFCVAGAHKASEATDYLHEALSIVDPQSHPKLCGALNDCLGYSFTLLGKREKAQQCLETAIGLFETVRDELQLANSLLRLSAFHEMHHDYDSAAARADHALALSRNRGFSPLEAQAIEILDASESRGRPGSNGQAKGFNRLVHSGGRMQSLARKARAVALTSENVLILGETGTGKELVARGIHEESVRNKGPFIAFNCSGISRDLIEARLFGYRKGAFTGAVADYAGIVPTASGGTLFLDEIGNLDPQTQGSLLRFLQSGEIQPVGAAKPVNVDVRVIAATNSNLADDVEAGRFRRDLYYRLNAFTILLPPLRSRPDDVLALVKHFVTVYCRRYQVEEPAWTAEELDWFVAHDWPGNVRELENYVKRRILLGLDDDEVDAPSDSRKAISDGLPSKMPPLIESGNGNPGTPCWRSCGPTEKEGLLNEALKKCGGNLSAAARELGISRRTIQRRRRGASFEEVAPRLTAKE